MNRSSSTHTDARRAFLDELDRRVDGEVRVGRMDRMLYATDASMYQIEPVAVLIPRVPDDVRVAVKLGDEYEIPVLPRGGGSSLAGQAVGEALIIDCSRHLDNIIDIDPEARTVRVQPGVVLDRLNEALEEYGLMVGPDPASSDRATLGGMVANNATGTHSILYGNMVNHIQEARVILADGSRAIFEAVDSDGWKSRASREGLEGDIYSEMGALLDRGEDIIRRDTPKHWRRAGGYRLERLLDTDTPNLAHLLCGSEGTLAIATELTIKVVPRPEQTALGVVQFKTRRAALEAVSTILSTDPSAVELFDRHGIDRCREVPEFARRLTFVEGRPGAVLITEYFGSSREELETKLDRLERLTKNLPKGYAVVRATEPQEIENVWKVRKAGLGLVMGVKGDHKPVAFVEDAAVPVENLPRYVERLEEVFDRTNTDAVIYAHASGGCLHVRPFINTKDAEEVEKMEQIAWASMELVRELGGDISSEHGNGLARSWLNEALFGEELYGLYRETKSIFDPDGILNPGKKVDAPPMSENLRLGPDYETRPLDTRIDFSDYQGFDRAIEQCNGSGVCRKLDGGTMCPSFMVTRDEEDSTRGRANALRAAMSGDLPQEDFTSERMYEVMDLCISCKACKTECPSEVDMARLKSEWLSHYWEEHGVPVRERLFAYLPVISRWISGGLAGMANRVNEVGWIRSLMENHLGISVERELPKFATTSFSDWYSQRPRPIQGKRVVLFKDTFNDSHTPEVSRAAYEFLTGIGYSVILVDHPCCGRTFFSKGLIAPARKRARKVVEQLYEYADRDVPIVGLEPSCITMLMDEYDTLLPNDYRVGAVAEAATSFDAFVAGRDEAGKLENVLWNTAARSLLVHGHCHQKALVGTTATEHVLGMIPGNEVEVVDSGCCGMAGSFGYEAEHVDISRKMARRKLIPAVEAADPGTTVVAPGFSCRSQLKNIGGYDGLHPAQVLRDDLQGVQ